MKIKTKIGLYAISVWLSSLIVCALVALSTAQGLLLRYLLDTRGGFFGVIIPLVFIVLFSVAIYKAMRERKNEHPGD